MITKKYYFNGKEVIFFDKGTNEDGKKIFTFYTIEHIPDNCPWKIINDPSEDMLMSLAVKTGRKVIKQYYVTPPDNLEWWMGTYTYFPNGLCMHCDPIAYGGDNRMDDISEATTDFMLKYGDKILPEYATKTELDSDTIQ